ncbi:MAG TPA: hypothetical protein VNA11_21715, partial [Pseudonocardia sp.]|nr:hypothetical protein [Pseudonocardia sp.]
MTELARFSSLRAETVEQLLDDGFEALVELLDWPVDEPEDGTERIEGRYDWTAYVLSDVSEALSDAVVVPSAGRVMRRAEMAHWTKRGVPSVGMAAVLASIVFLSVATQPASDPMLPGTSYTYADPVEGIDRSPGPGVAAGPTANRPRGGTVRAYMAANTGPSPFMAEDAAFAQAFARANQSTVFD